MTTQAATAPVSVISANLRKDMGKVAWENALNVVLNEMSPDTTVGLQEVSSGRNKDIVRAVCKERGLHFTGLSYECPVIFDPQRLMLVNSVVHPVKDSSRLFFSPTRVTNMNQWRDIPTGIVRGHGNGHRMNGVYTSDAPLSFYKWRKAAWHNHFNLDQLLVTNWSLLGGNHVPLWMTMDGNAHKPKYVGNPYGHDVLLLEEHVSDYLGVNQPYLRPEYQVNEIASRTFKTGSDHLALLWRGTVTYNPPNLVQDVNDWLLQNKITGVPAADLRAIATHWTSSV